MQVHAGDLLLRVVEGSAGLHRAQRMLGIDEQPNPPFASTLVSQALRPCSEDEAAVNSAPRISVRHLNKMRRVILATLIHFGADCSRAK